MAQHSDTSAINDRGWTPNLAIDNRKWRRLCLPHQRWRQEQRADALYLKKRNCLMGRSRLDAFVRILRIFRAKDVAVRGSLPQVLFRVLFLK